MRFAQPDVSTAAGRILARIGLVCLALLCLAGGGLAAWYLGVQPLADAWRSRHWQPVSAIIEDVHLTGGAGGGNRGARVSVSYRYRFDGHDYRGERYGLHRWMDNAEAQQAAYAQLLYARRAQAWVNPADPGEALLNRDLHWSIVGMALPALAVLGVGLVILWAAGSGGLATWRAARRLKRAGVR